MVPFGIAVVVTLLDQLTKFLVRRDFELFEAVSVVPGLLDLRYIQNTGAAWGIFQGGALWLGLLSLLVLVVLIIFRHSFFSHRAIDQVAFGLMTGGIIGNLIDRLRLFYVVDFLDFHWQGYHFPAFNVADAAICTGVFLYFMAQVFQSYKTKKPSPDSLPLNENGDHHA